jgi:hypothetical protein
MIKCGNGIRCGKGTKCNKKTMLCESSDVKANVRIQTPVNIPINIPVRCGNGIRCGKGTKCNKKTMLCESSIPLAQSIHLPEAPPLAQSIHLPEAPSSIYSVRSTSSSTKRKRKAKVIEQKAKVVGQFMQRTKHARRATFLNTICSKSGVCIAFGTYSDKIKQFFNGFSAFDYVSSIARIGNPSANGFIYSINYEHRGYKSNAVLKSSMSSTADNLMYEYIVGIEINKLCKRFPIFLETYKCYKYKDELTRNNFYAGTAPNKLLKTGLIPYDAINNAQYADSCSNSKSICILIQHIENAKTLNDFLLDVHDSDFVKNELIYIIYQIYFALSSIHYTHYDLHTNNVIIYTPDPTKYIQYHYNLGPGKTISFKSRHMVKLIDYGRNYIQNATNIAKNAVCSVPECEKTCGNYSGYKLDDSQTPSSFITPWKENVSHDLRLITIIIKILKIRMPHMEATGAISTCSVILTKHFDVIYSGIYGTAENPIVPLFKLDPVSKMYKIRNVGEMNLILETLMMNDVFSESDNNAYAAPYTKLGELMVDKINPMVYTSA